MPRNTSRSPETNAAALLGQELARLRVEVGFTIQASFAAELGYERSVIGKAESGDRPPSDAVFNAWMDLCHVTGTVRAMLERQLILARNEAGGFPDWFAWWVEIEKQADSIRIWQPLLIPGLLQVEEYFRAMYVLAGMDEDEAANKAAVQLERQKIVRGEDAVHLTVVIDESVLHSLIGTADIMVKQLTHLLAMSKRGNVILQIVRGDGRVAGLNGAFQIARGAEIPDTLLLQGFEDHTVTNRDMVRKAAAVFEQIRGHALNVEESRTVIQEAIERWKREQ